MPITAEDNSEPRRGDDGPDAVANQAETPPGDGASPPAATEHCSHEGEVLSRAEIEALFDSEWVLVGDPDFDEHLGVRRGTILWHSPDRDEVDRKDTELRPTSAAYLFTGVTPADGEAVVL